MKRQQLFHLVWFDKEKNIYFIDRGNEVIARVYVDSNDEIIKTVGFGQLSNAIKQWNDSLSGKKFVETYLSRRYRHKLIFDEGSSRLLPMVINKDKPLCYLQFRQDLRNVTYVDKAINNWLNSGWTISKTSDPNIVYLHTYY